MERFQSKVTTQVPNQYLDYLNETSFQGLSRLFALRFDINASKIRNSNQLK